MSLLVSYKDSSGLRKKKVSIHLSQCEYFVYTVQNDIEAPLEEGTIALFCLPLHHRLVSWAYNDSWVSSHHILVPDSKIKERGIKKYMEMSFKERLGNYRGTLLLTKLTKLSHMALLHNRGWEM